VLGAGDRHPPLALQQHRGGQQHQHAHCDHDGAADQLQAAAVVEELPAQHAGTCSGQGEHRGEADHEAHGRGRHPAAMIGQRAGRHAGHERQVAGDQRPHAGREHRHHPGREGDRELGG
jgi:hypothetical protein